MSIKDRDLLQRRAIRLLGEHHRLLMAAKKAPMPERAELARTALKASAEAREAVRRFYESSVPRTPG